MSKFELERDCGCDQIAVVDIWNRVEQLTGFVGVRDDNTSWSSSEYASELEELTDVLEELRGHAGPAWIGGAWYPELLILEDAFDEYAHACIVKAVGSEVIGESDKWPLRCVDWSDAIEELWDAHTLIDIGGSTYLFKTGEV